MYGMTIVCVVRVAMTRSSPVKVFRAVSPIFKTNLATLVPYFCATKNKETLPKSVAQI